MQFKIRLPLIFCFASFDSFKAQQFAQKNLKFKRNDLVYKNIYTGPVVGI